MCCARGPGSVIIPSLTTSVGGKGDRGGSGSLIQPQQVFAEIKRYSSLMGRRNIAAALQTEKETLAKQVDKHLDSVQVRPTPRLPLHWYTGQSERKPS